MYKQRLASNQLQSAFRKVWLVTEYLSMCEYHEDGHIGNLEAVIQLLQEARDEVDSVADFMPDEPLRKVRHV